MREKRVDLLIGNGGGKEAESIRRQRSLGFKITASVDIFFLWEKALPPSRRSTQLGSVTTTHGRSAKPQIAVKLWQGWGHRAKALGDKP